MDKYTNQEIKTIAGEKKGERLAFLDGVRGMAILLVLTAHYFAESGVVRIGWIGVNLFFILSGYLITGRLYQTRERNAVVYFRDFYIRRVLRIFPLYYGTLVVFFLLLPHLYPGYDRNFSEVAQGQVWYWTFQSNWKLVVTVPGNITLAVFWSLAVEEQFYIIWPFVMRYVRVKLLFWLFFLLIALSIAGRQFISLGVPFYQPYFSTATACEPLIAGAMICVLERTGRLGLWRRYIGWASLAGLLVLVMVFMHNGDPSIENPWLIRWGYTAIDGLFACLLVLLLSPGTGTGKARKLFSARWIRWLGKYSYGIYIFHWLLLYTVVFKGEKILAERGWGEGYAYLASRGGGIVIVLLLSYASFHIYEERFLRLKKYFTV